MTMVIATKLNTSSLHLHGDSIETSEIVVNSGMRLPDGITSHNERTIPEVIATDRYMVFREKVCKIGRLTAHIACSVSGNAGLAYEILDIFYLQAREVQSLNSMRDILQVIRSSIEGSLNYVGESCRLLFVCRFDQHLYACGAFFDISDIGGVSLELKKLEVEGDSYWQITEGSGVCFMQNYFPGSVKEFLGQDPKAENISTEMLALDYSTWLRFKNRGVANGVGGAVLGLKMSNSSCTYMGDTLFLYADYRGSLEVAVKIIQRDGLFLVTDFISRSVTAMRTLESELEFRRNRSSEATDITKLVKEALLFQSPLILVDSRAPDSPLQPNIGIIENQNGTAVGSMEFNLQFQDGLPYFPPGTKLKISSREQSYNFIVRIP